MKHIVLIGKQRPAPAQFESVIQLVGLLNSFVTFLGNLGFLFGIDFASKAGNGET